MRKFLFLLAALLICVQAVAEDIEVPEEELARETTLPVFRKRQIVLNRSVVTAKRLEIAGGAGLALNDPFYNTLMYGAQGTYNFTETSALNIQGLFWSPGLSSYGEQLKQPNPPKRPEGFDASKAPHPKWALLANYEYVAYYGKISLTKQGVMNLNTFGIAGLGYLNIDPINTIAADLGIGQNFFVTNNIGLRWDLRWLIYQGPDATSQRLTATDNPSASSFGSRLYYDAQVGLSLVFIL